MAIINCPECNGSISDTVKQCVHCGVTINVCPECKAVYTEKLDACKSCGYTFVNRSGAKAPTIGEECTDASSVIKKWETSEPLLVNLFKGWIWMALIAVSAILLGIGVIMMFTWKVEELLTNASSYQSTLSNIKTLVIFSAVFFVLQGVYGSFGEHYKTLRLSDWCVRKHIDFNRIIGHSLSQDFDALSVDKAGEELGGLQWLTRAAVYAKKIAVRTKLQAIAIVMSALTIAESIFLAIFVTNNVEALMYNKLLYGNLTLKVMGDWWLLAAFAVCFIVFKALDSYVEKAKEGECEEWVRKNLPDNVKTYNRYVPSDKMVEYLMKRGGVD